MALMTMGVTFAVQQFAVRQQEEIIHRNVESTGRFMAASLADHIAAPLAQSQYLEIREILSNMHQRDSRLTLTAISDFSTPKSEIVATIGENTIRDAASDVFSDRIISAGGVDQYVFFEPIKIRGVAKLLGTVRIALSLDFMRDRLQQTRDSMFAIMLVAVGVALGLAYVISSALLDPLNKLSLGILKIAGGDFSHKIQVKSQDEIGKMAHTFNRMTANLQILQEVSKILTEQAGPREVLTAVIARLARGSSGKIGSLVFRGLDGEELAVGATDEASLLFLRTLKQDTTRQPGAHPAPLNDSLRLCFPFFSEGEVTGGIWITRSNERPIDEIDERLLSGVSDQLESTLSKLEFQYRAVTDALTSLHNHRFFQQEMTRQIDRADRMSGVFSLVLSDIDHFKKVNDTHGHQQGDVVLRGVADAIKKTMRGKVDVGCRYGGEEFGIVLPETGLDGAKVFAERFRAAVEALEFDFNGAKIKCTISMGIATYPAAATEKRALIEAADRALYLAKESGRNCIKTFQDIS